jgi:ABC-type branched-subunit amino acid transport system substrate-binding protein
MENVTGTAPAAGGPNQQAFNDLFQEQYDSAPGVFTSQSFDSAAIGILANAAAGENNGPAVKEQMRRIANPGGMEVGPQNFVEGVEAAANGEDINYQGASSATNFDQNGDPASAAYAIWEFEGVDSQSTTAIETQSFAGSNPEGAGPSADSGPGGSDREISLGILLPETGSLASTGQPMIQAAQIPGMLVNENNPAGLSVNAQVEDTQTSPSAGVAAGNSLASAGVPFICGTASSGVNVPFSQQVAIPNEIVGCSPSSTALSVTNLEDNDFIFRTAPSDRLQGRVMAQVMSERLGADTVSTLYVNNDYGQQLSNRFSSVFEDQFDGSVLTQVAYNRNESSYSSVIQTALQGEQA